MMALEKRGRRYYLKGAPFKAKDLLKARGCKWDPQEMSWWTGKKDLAEELETKVRELDDTPDKPETVDPSAPVIRGRVRYKDRTYYLLAERRDGKGVKCCFRDGSKVFWTRKGAPFEILKRYRDKMSIDRLLAYAEERKAEQRGEIECRTCERYCTCGRSFCHHHHDGCERCGAEY